MSIEQPTPQAEGTDVVTETVSDLAAVASPSSAARQPFTWRQAIMVLLVALLFSGLWFAAILWRTADVPLAHPDGEPWTDSTGTTVQVTSFTLTRTAPGNYSLSPVIEAPPGVMFLKADVTISNLDLTRDDLATICNFVLIGTNGQSWNFDSSVAPHPACSNDEGTTQFKSIYYVVPEHKLDEVRGLQQWHSMGFIQPPLLRPPPE